MDKGYISGVSDRAMRTSSFFRNNTRWITLILIILAVIITLILVLVNRYGNPSESYLLGATYYDIITVTICLFLFINLCIGYGSSKMEYS